MTLALLSFFILIYIFFHSLGDTANYRRPFIVISTIVMILISGLRHQYVGNDTYVTMEKFESNSYTEWKYIIRDLWSMYTEPSKEYGKDPGELVFDKIISMFTTDSRTFLFIVAAITLVSLASFVYRRANTLHSVLFSYMFFVSLLYSFIPNSAVRQTIAIAILFYAYRFLQQKKYLWFILFLFFASTFHKSALVVGIMLPLLYVKQVRYVYYGCIPFFFFMLFFYNEVAVFLGAANDVYEGYLAINYYTSTGQSRPFMVIIMVAGLYLYNMIILERDRNWEENKIYYIGTGLTLVFTPLVLYDPSALRIMAYFGMFVPIISGNLCTNTAITRNGFIAIAIIFYMRAARQPDDGYRFLWQEKAPPQRTTAFNALKKDSYKSLILVPIQPITG